MVARNISLHPNDFRRQRDDDIRQLGQDVAEWLTTAQRGATPGLTVPWAPHGREYVGFGETFCRVLSWHKIHKLRNFNPLGWHVNREEVERLKDGFQRFIAEALGDSDMPSSSATWLRDYDVSPVSEYTAIDQRFETVTGGPTRVVLDFGSGIGRQALIWRYERTATALISVDAIESLYILQNELYTRVWGDSVSDYFTEPQRCRSAAEELAPGTIIHIPTWRLAWIPAERVDLVVCVQVLQELPETTLRYVLGQFRRVIRPGGLLYIRDNEFWTPEHRVRVGRELLRTGWHLAFRYPGNEGTDIEGVPRLWTYTGRDYGRYFRWPVRLKRLLLPSYNKSYRSWRDVGLPI